MVQMKLPNGYESVTKLSGKRRNYYDSHFKPLMEQLKIDRTPHCYRHTCISMLAGAGVDQTIIKKIVGHLLQTCCTRSNFQCV